MTEKKVPVNVPVNVPAKVRVMFPRVTVETIREMRAIVNMKGGVEERTEGRLFSQQRVDMFATEQPDLVALAHDISDLAGDDPSVFAFVATGMSIAYDGLKRQMEKGE